VRRSFLVSTHFSSLSLQVWMTFIRSGWNSSLFINDQLSTLSFHFIIAFFAWSKMNLRPLSLGSLVSTLLPSNFPIPPLLLLTSTSFLSSQKDFLMNIVMSPHSLMVYLPRNSPFQLSSLTSWVSKPNSLDLLNDLKKSSPLKMHLQPRFIITDVFTNIIER
jgi:hypothetical protein